MFTNISARCTHLRGITRKTTAFILLFGISHLRFYGLAALTIFFVPDLFGVCHLLLVLWDYTDLCRFISTIPRVAQIGPSLCFRWFFSCVLFYSLREMCCCYQSGRSGHTVLGGLDRTGLDWTSKTRTCKTWTCNKTRTSIRRTCKTRTQDRLLRTSSLFWGDFFRVCKSDKTER